MSDLISRQAAIDALGEQPTGYSYGEYEEGLISQWKSDIEAIKQLSSAEPQKWNRLMMHLADLQLTYAPADGHGDIKLYEFVTGLIKELEGWEENAD